MSWKYLFYIYLFLLTNKTYELSINGKEERNVIDLRDMVGYKIAQLFGDCSD